MAQLGYNAADVPPDERGDFTVMPEGRYKFLVEKSEVKDGKKPGAKRLIFTVCVKGPTHVNQKLWPDFNFINPSAEAQRIGRQQLNKFAEACGVPAAALKDSSQLHNKMFEGDVSVIPAEGSYPAKNEIKRFYPVTGGSPAPRPVQAPPPQQQAQPPAQAPAASAPAPTPAPAAGGVPPWLQKG